MASRCEAGTARGMEGWLGATCSRRDARMPPSDRSARVAQPESETDAAQAQRSDAQMAARVWM
jgi:hypothetical protein